MFVTLESGSITELAAELGLDWVVVDTEHTHLGYKEILEHIRAAKGSSTSVLVRVPTMTVDSVNRVLDIGADGVILPLIRSRRELEYGFAVSRYPPVGVRGIGGDRAFSWGLHFDEYLARANDDILVIPLIETADAVRDIDEILATPGLEAIYLGPHDLSASLGHTGEWEGPDVAEHLSSIAAKARGRGIASGIIALDIDDLSRRLDQGFRMIGLGSDMSLLIGRIRELIAAAGELR